MCKFAPETKLIAYEEIFTTIGECCREWSDDGWQHYTGVSGDDRTVPVLGYGETGSFDVDNMPENMKAWLQGYVDQIEWLNAHPETPVATKTTRRSSSAVRVRTERTIYRQRAISDEIKKERCGFLHTVSFLSSYSAYTV